MEKRDIRFIKNEVFWHIKFVGVMMFLVAIITSMLVLLWVRLPTFTLPEESKPFLYFLTICSVLIVTLTSYYVRRSLIETNRLRQQLGGG